VERAPEFRAARLAGLAGPQARGNANEADYAHGYTPQLIVILLLGALASCARSQLHSRRRLGTPLFLWNGLVRYGGTDGVADSLEGLPKNHATDMVKLAVYCGVLMGMASWRYGVLPRTRPILPAN